MTDIKKVLVTPEVPVPLTEQDRFRERKFYIKVGAITVAAALSGAITLGVLSSAANYPSTTVKEGPKIESESSRLGTVDSTISSVLLFDGAKLRSEPQINIADVNAGDPDGVIDTIHNHDGVYVKTPDHDVSVKSDPDNKIKWYSVTENGKTGWVDSDHAAAIREEK